MNRADVQDILRPQLIDLLQSVAGIGSAHAVEVAEYAQARATDLMAFVDDPIDMKKAVEIAAGAILLEAALAETEAHSMMVREVRGRLVEILTIGAKVLAVAV